MKIGKGSAPGKVIIAGEHSVVYSYPAIAVALGLRCNTTSKVGDPGIFIHSLDMKKDCRYTLQEIDKLMDGETIHPSFDNIAFAISKTLKKINEKPAIEVQIQSDIPISAGLGSSAAVVVASIASVLDLYNKKISLNEISSIAFNAEKITHGRPSGIDNSIATYGGMIKFETGNIEQKDIKNSIPLIIGNTKIPRDTKKLVTGVLDLKNQQSEIISPILSTMGELAIRAEIFLENNDLLKLGDIMNMNQGLLDSIGVGHKILSRYIWDARDAGALGAKLTGAGGGGCMIALAKDIKSQFEIVSKLNSLNYNIISTEISKVGVLIGEQR